jgi:hypothetical protein
VKWGVEKGIDGREAMAERGELADDREIAAGSCKVRERAAGLVEEFVIAGEH